jgi:hypothetical protein
MRAPPARAHAGVQARRFIPGLGESAQVVARAGAPRRRPEGAAHRSGHGEIEVRQAEQHAAHDRRLVHLFGCLPGPHQDAQHHTAECQLLGGGAQCPW